MRRASRLTRKLLKADEKAVAKDTGAAAVSGPDQSQRDAVAESEAAVREAEREARAAERAAEQYSTLSPQPTPRDDLASQLDDLAQLRDEGALTQAEFEAAKSRLLGG
jgi:hypothetical protein